MPYIGILSIYGHVRGDHVAAPPPLLFKITLAQACEALYQLFNYSGLSIIPRLIITAGPTWWWEQYFFTANSACFASSPSSFAILYSRKLKAQPSLKCDWSMSFKVLYDGSLIYSSNVLWNLVPVAHWAFARRALLQALCVSKPLLGCWVANYGLFFLGSKSGLLRNHAEIFLLQIHDLRPKLSSKNVYPTTKYPNFRTWWTCLV